MTVTGRQFAIGGTGLVFTEASAVESDGRISPRDAGIWNGEQAAAWRRITDFLHAYGARADMQLAHAGRKGSTQRPWDGSGSVPESDGGRRPVGPGVDAYTARRRLTEPEIAALPGLFADAAARAVGAGFDVVELHFAHGYLVRQFYSPLSNDRTDRYGGDFEGRTRLALEIAEAGRATVGERFPVFARVSASDWAEGGWGIEDTVALAKLLGERGVDLIDASSGGNTPHPDVPLGPGYQVPFAERIRAEAGLPTAAVGLITEPEQAEEIIASGAADAVFLARAMLRDPHWAQRAARVLGAEVRWPAQYARAAR